MKNIKRICVALFILAVIFKLFLFRYEYTDFIWFLRPWVGHIQSNGYFEALKDPFHNYTMPYMYVLVFIAKLKLSTENTLFLIKIISVIFEYVAAFYIGKLAFMVKKDKIVIWLSLAIIPLVPTILLNSSYQSQCDSIYAAFAIASVYYVLNDRKILSMILLGIAFSLKLQTAMVLPFFFVYMLRGNIKWYYFSIIPLVYIITALPAWIAGRPMLDLLTIYINQAEFNPEIVGNFPNFYKLFGFLFDDKKYLGTILMAIITLGIGFMLKSKKIVFDTQLWLKFLFLSTILCPYFLPGMLERYMYLGDLCAILYILVFRNKIYLPLGVLFVSFYSYVRTLHVFTFSPGISKAFSFFEFLPWTVVALLFSVIVALAFIDLYNQIKNNNTGNGKLEHSPV